MTARRILQSTARRLGWEVRRYPRWDHRWKTVRLLEFHSVDTVLDVGANLGQYASSLRQFGFTGEIVSFEPVSSAYAQLARAAHGDPRWQTRNVALGADERDVLINVAGNNAASSSVLPMLQRHREAAPEANFVSSEEVRQSTVDLQVSGLEGGRMFLKIDTQGYEGEVLQGARQALSGGRFVGVQLEVSFVPLYDAAPGWVEILQLVEGFGMTPMAVEPGFTDPRSGQLLQADFVFFRDPARPLGS